MGFRLKRAKLVNFLQLIEGSGLKTVEIDFTDFNKKDIRKIMILGRNGSGKTELMAALTPFAESFTNRPHIIVPGENGSKEIDYEDDDGTIVRCEHLWSKAGSVRSFIYIKKANEDEFQMLQSTAKGLVTVFKDEVKNIFNIDADFISISRVGTTISSFIDLKPTDRKKYLAKFIEQIEEWTTANKNASAHLQEARKEAKGLQIELDRLPESSITNHELNVVKQVSKIAVADHTKYVSEFGGASAKLESCENNIAAAFSKVNADSRISTVITKHSVFGSDLTTLSAAIKKAIDKTIVDRDAQISVISKLNEYTTTDAINAKINELSAKQAAAQSELTGIIQLRSIASARTQELKSNLNNTSNQIERIKNAPAQLDQLKVQLASHQADLEKAETEAAMYADLVIDASITYDQVKQTSDAIVRLKNDVEEIAACFTSEDIIEIANQHNFSISGIQQQIVIQKEKAKAAQSDIETMTKRSATAQAQNRFAEQMQKHKCSYPSCPHEAYLARLASGSDDVKRYEREIANARQVIENVSGMIDTFNILLNGLRSLNSTYTSIAACKSVLTMINASEWISSKSKFIKLLQKPASEIDKILSVGKYIAALNARRLVENSQNHVNRVSEQISSLEEKVQSLNYFVQEQERVAEQFEKAVLEASEVETRFNEANTTVSKYTRIIDIFIRYSNAVAKLAELEAANAVVDAAISNNTELLNEHAKLTNSTQTLESLINNANIAIDEAREKIRVLEYNKQRRSEFEDRMNILQNKIAMSQLIVDVTSPTKGAPVNFIKAFIDKIRFIVNDLLDPVVNKTLRLNFELNEKEFRIPVHRSSGRVIPDAVQCSEGQRSVIKTILSMALVKNLYSNSNEIMYPIIGLDEIDGPLDEESYRRKFVQVIDRLCREVGIKQVFMITHNDEFYADELGLILLPGHCKPIDQENFIHNKTVIADFS